MQDRKIQLGDGRSLGYAEYGAPEGYPIFGFHGLPGSRIWFEGDDPVAEQLGIRLITIDRPGYGISDPKPGRRFLDFADDVVALAQQLQIDRFSVFGISGGGVYAAACAYRFPQYIAKAGLVSTVNQFVRGRPPKEMSSVNRMVFIMARWAPWLLRWMLRQQKRVIDQHPEKYKQSSRRQVQHLCAWDREILAQGDIGEALWLHMREAFRNGVEAAVAEAQLFIQPWGFEVREMAVPVVVWHGTSDTLAPIGPIEELAGAIPDCEAHFLEGKGHFLSEDEGIWAGILDSLKPGGYK